MDHLRTLRILLYQQPLALADYLIVAESGQTMLQAVQGNLADLKLQQCLPQLDQIIVFIPTQDVWLTMLELPSLPARQLRHRIATALAPRLLAPPSTLHFAVGPRQADGFLPVAVISHNKLSAWLALLRKHKIRPQLLLPASFALAYEPQQPQLAMLDTVCQVRSGLYSGFACELVNLPLLLAASDATQGIANANLAPLHLAPGAIPAAINLLPPEFVSLPAWQAQPRNAKLWFKAGLLLIILLLLLLLWPLQAVLSWRLRSQALKQQVAIIYRQQRLPWWQPAPHILATQLLKQRAAHDPELFWSLLQLMAQHAQLLKIRAISWQHATLAINLSAPTVASLVKFITTLEAANFIVQEQHRVVAAKVQARLLVRRG